jgi:hypothetical protein
VVVLEEILQPIEAAAVAPEDTGIFQPVFLLHLELRIISRLV